MSSTSNTWLWIGTYGMLAGTVIILLLGRGLAKAEQYHAHLAAVITGIAFTAYYAMAKHFGDIMVGGTTVQVARYVDWVVTTPLLLLSLVVVAAPKLKDAGWSITTLILADVYMIVTGLLAGLVHGGEKVFFYVVSSVGLVVVWYFLFGPFMATAKAAGEGTRKLYSNLTWYLSALWLAYPIVWALGTTGKGSFDFGVENALYAVLDLLAKAVFGIMIVTNLKKSSN